jgi:hypothetical protein
MTLTSGANVIKLIAAYCPIILTEVTPIVKYLRRKKFYDIDTCGQCYKTFTAVICEYPQ